MQSPTRSHQGHQFTNFRSPARSTHFPSPPASTASAVSPRKRRSLGGDASSTRHRANSSPVRPPTSLRMEWKSETYTTLRRFFNKPIPDILIEDKGKSSVRGPAPFDLHLDKSLILKTIKRSSLIVPDLLEIAMNSLEQLESERFLPRESSGLSYAALLTEILPPDSISAQSDLANHYATKIAADCSLVAAALHLRLPTWTTAKALEYSRDTSGQTHSKADGYLRLRLGALDSIELTYETYGTLRGTNKKFPRLATWMFKRLSEDKEERIMKQIIKFSNDDEFPWTSCEGDECNHLSADGSAHITGAPRGSDATSLTIRLEETYWSYDDGFDDDEDTTVGDIRNAGYIIQQAWAQSVANDTTILVIKSPNYEIIGHRDRENQSLLLSDLIHVPTFQEGYMQLQVGLYMTVVEDAFSRYHAGKIVPMPRVKYDIPAVRAVKLKKPKSEQERMANGRAVKHALLGFEKLAFHVRVTPGPKPDFPKFLMQSTYLRASEPANSGSGTLHVALEKMPDSNICIGRVTAGRATIDDSIVCKIAHGREEADWLGLEYQAYQTLAARNVPCLSVYGLFHSNDGSAVMLLEHIKLHPEVLTYNHGYSQLLDKIHALGLVLGKLSEKSLLCTDYGYTCFGALSHLRRAKNAEEQEKEMKALKALFGRPTQRPRISHALSIGPFTEHHDGQSPVEKFHFVVNEMRITSPRPIRVSEGQIPDMIDVEFEDKESRSKFFDKWCSARKPLGFGKLGCTVRL